MGVEDFEIFWRSWADSAFHTPLEIWEYLLLALYSLTAVLLLVYAWRDFRRLLWRRFPLFIGLLIAPLFFSNFLVIVFARPNLLPPNIPAWPAHPFAALLGALPVAVAGAWLGAGPAMLVGLVGGVLHARMATGYVGDIFYFAFAGFLLGFLLRQDYRGHLPRVVRQPIIAGPLSTLLAVPILLASVFAREGNAGLAGLDYAVSLVVAHFLPMLLESLVAALVLSAAYLFPPMRPVRAAYRFPPYARSLNGRFLFLFVPLILVMTFTLVYAVTKRTLNVATVEVVDEMERDASSAA